MNTRCTIKFLDIRLCKAYERIREQKYISLRIIQVVEPRRKREREIKEIKKVKKP